MAIGSPQWMYKSGEAYTVDQSLKLDSASVANLQFTPSSASNRKTWTLSFWCKVGDIASGEQSIFTAGTSCTDRLGVMLDGGNHFSFNVCGVGDVIETQAVYRDPSAWLHCVFVLDTTQSTSTDRGKIYVNGESVALTHNSSLTLNKDYTINNNTLHAIGALSNAVTSASYTFGGYLGEMHFVDGQALTPSDFGETGTYGEWKPIEYSGTYGTNGFYLPFKQDYTVEGFSTVTYKGTSASQYIGGTGFKPDLVWAKSRGQAYGHQLYDSVRGATKRLQSNDTSSESTQVNNLTAFNNDGFTLGSDAGINQSGDNVVAWGWDMGGTTATNTSGSENSTVRANPTYGQSIVSYVGKEVAGTTYGHGLNSAPEFIIVKNLSRSSNWKVYYGDNTKALALNTTGATDDQTYYWNDTSPTSSVFTVGGGTDTNGNDENLVAYCFHSVSGYSKFGSYTGNGNLSGTSVTLGFRPAWVMIRKTDSADWLIFDSTRNPLNEVRSFLEPNTTDVETIEQQQTMN